MQTNGLLMSNFESTIGHLGMVAMRLVSHRLNGRLFKKFFNQIHAYTALVFGF